MVDTARTSAYAYTAGNQLWTEDGPWASDTVTNVYYNRMRTNLSLAQATSSWTNGFGYDAAKRLTNVASSAGSFGYTYASAASRLTRKIDLQNTSYITNIYDTMARLKGTSTLALRKVTMPRRAAKPPQKERGAFRMKNWVGREQSRSVGAKGDAQCCARRRAG